MKRGSLAPLLGLAILGVGTARGEAYLATGGTRHYASYRIYQGYVSPSLLNSGGFSAGFNQTEFLALSDFNGDGIPDLAVSDSVSILGYVGSVSVLDGKTWTAITTIQLNTPGPTDGNGAPIAAGDVNGDGVPDLIVGPNPGAGGSTQIHVYNGKDWTPLSTTYTPVGPRVATADFNHDGKSDIITSGTVYDAVNGTVLFNFPTGTGVNFCAGDVNGDGTPDIAVEDGAAISVYSGINQQLIRTFPGSGTPFYSIAIADMNQDGYGDLLRYDGTNGVKIFSGLDGSVLNTSSPFPPDPSFAGEIAAFVSVPEPATVGALALGSLTLLLRRRRS